MTDETALYLFAAILCSGCGTTIAARAPCNRCGSASRRMLSLRPTVPRRPRIISTMVAGLHLGNSRCSRLPWAPALQRRYCDWSARHHHQHHPAGGHDWQVAPFTVCRNFL